MLCPERKRRMRRLPHVTWLRAFDAAARHSSFTAAADELHLTPAAVSQQIRLLEKRLGAELFKRLPKGVALTDVGQAYAQPLRKSFLEMEQATDGLFRGQRKATLRVRSSISFGALVLAPRLNAFRERHPEIEIDLFTTVWSDRMTDAGIDLDIRYGDGDWPERNIWPLEVDDAVVVCHPDHASSLGDGLSIEGLAAASVVQVVGSETDWGRLSDKYGLDLPAPVHWMKADSSLVALQILTSGHGSSLISRSFAGHYLKTGALIAPVPYQISMLQKFFLVQYEDTNKSPEIAVFKDWLTSQKF
ncbi:LysR substrate-binding domain-containing protein [Roseovarius nitratireducens]|uniref:LysR substrate-binding domain-containing protein n=1 Tax=Roseovarius nitratireducens TaxID=2044597 RepID=UPI000CE25900|nr:LysR substrate-binding domain-containing protein [Roseovarius nitratireducens]